MQAAGSMRQASDLPGQDCWTFTWIRGSGCSSVIFLPLLEIASRGTLVVFHSRNFGEDGVIKVQIPYGANFLESLFGRYKDIYHPGMCCPAVFEYFTQSYSKIIFTWLLPHENISLLCCMMMFSKRYNKVIHGATRQEAMILHAFLHTSLLRCRSC